MTLLQKCSGSQPGYRGTLGYRGKLQGCRQFLNLTSIYKELQLEVPPNCSITKQECRESKKVETHCNCETGLLQKRRGMFQKLQTIKFRILFRHTKNDMKNILQNIQTFNLSRFQVREWDEQFSERYTVVGKLLKPGEERSNYSDDEDEPETVAETKKDL